MRAEAGDVNAATEFILTHAVGGVAESMYIA
jgi:hypothetical protein